MRAAMTAVKTYEWWVCLALAVINTIWGAIPGDTYIATMLCISAMCRIEENNR